MTQVNGAQAAHSELAWQDARKGRTLAQRRADFEAQVRSTLLNSAEMALTDLSQVRARMKALHMRYDARYGKIGQQELAKRLGVAYRTFQSWENAEVETDRVNYDKVARFYARKLKDSKITADWILFGRDGLPPLELPTKPVDPYAEQLDRIEEKLDELLRRIEAQPDEGDEGGGTPDALPPDPDRPPDAPDADEPPSDEAQEGP